MSATKRVCCCGLLVLWCVLYKHFSFVKELLFKGCKGGNNRGLERCWPGILSVCVCWKRFGQTKHCLSPNNNVVLDPTMQVWHTATSWFSICHHFEWTREGFGSSWARLCGTVDVFDVWLSWGFCFPIRSVRPQHQGIPRSKPRTLPFISQPCLPCLCNVFFKRVITLSINVSLIIFTAKCK